MSLPHTLLYCNSTGVPEVCAQYSYLPDGSPCDQAVNLPWEKTWQSCDCLAISAQQNATINRIDRWEARQAASQWAFSMLSLLSGGAYMLLFLRSPKEMWRYPQSLAFWIYACDFVKSLSLNIVSGNLLATTRERLAEAGLPYVITWHPDCLCALPGADRHPGCSCRGGFLAMLLQGGLVGSIAFYCAMTHNFYCSVRDPFTKVRPPLLILPWPLFSSPSLGPPLLTLPWPFLVTLHRRPPRSPLALILPHPPLLTLPSSPSPPHPPLLRAAPPAAL